MKNKLGENLKLIREKWEVSQEAFAFLIDATRGMVMQYENRGTMPKPGVFKAIYNITGYSKEELLNSILNTKDIKGRSDDAEKLLEIYFSKNKNEANLHESAKNKLLKQYRNSSDKTLKSELASKPNQPSAMSNETLKDKLIENLLEQVQELKEELAQYKRNPKSKEAS